MERLMTADQLVMNLLAFVFTFSMLAALFDVGRRTFAVKMSRTDEAPYRWGRFAVGILVGIIWMLAIVRSVQVSHPLFDHALLQERFAWLVFLTSSSTMFWLLTFGANRSPFMAVAIAGTICVMMIVVLMLSLLGIVHST